MKRVSTYIFFCCLLAINVAAQKTITLSESISIALKNNIEVAQSDLAVGAAEINHKQSKNNLLPSVNGIANQGINRGRSIDPFTNTYVNQKVSYGTYGLGSEVLLFNGLTLQNAIKQNKFAYDAAKMDLQQAKDDLTLAVLLAYLQVLSSEDQVALAIKQVEVTRVQLNRLEKLNNDGAISPAQVFDLRGQLKEAELNLVTAQNAVGTSKLMLTQLMTIPFDPTIQLEKIGQEELLQKFSGTADDVYNAALNNLAAIKAAELRTKGAEAAVKVSKGGLYPTLALTGNLNTNYSSAATNDVFTTITEVPTSNYVLINGNKEPVFQSQKNFQAKNIPYSSQLQNNVFSNVGVSLRLPLFNGFLARNRIKLATIDYKNAALQATNIKWQTRREIDQAYVNMNNAWERYTLLTEQVAAYGESFRAAEVRFTAGVGSTVDYMIAKTNFDRASINQVSAQFEYLLRKKILEYYSSR